jgi:hypothetical protein
MGMQNQSASPVSRWINLVVRLQSRIGSCDFCARHRQSKGDFTRRRVLPFAVVVVALLQKTTKSVQRHLHSFLHQLWPQEKLSVTGGAWTQARAKLSHTAFIELNQEVLLPDFYALEHSSHRQTWRGHRLLGCDGSLLRLPSHPEVFRLFGKVDVANHHGPTGTCYAPARLSVLYDLLNQIGLDASMEPVSRGELELVLTQLKHVQANDVLIWDRGFTGFVLMARVLGRGAHFIGRCSQGSFAAAQDLFRRNQHNRSLTVKLVAAREHRAELEGEGLPRELTVRFVSVRLPTGELEVLVTSLLDETRYPAAEFLQVYHYRWNHETYHQMLKGRLDLENWTGQTVEAVKQDVQAAVLVANLETLLSQEPQEQLSQSDDQRQYPAQVNRAVSYHALKEHILDLLWSRRPIEHVVQHIQHWMKSNPVCVRPDRSPPRRPQSFNRSYHYQRNLRKTVF